MADQEKICPCCSGDLYKNCCEPFHKGRIVRDALQLMRSRFSAYALCLPEYIIRTTDPASPQYIEDLKVWEKEISEFSKSVSFERLEILDHREEKPFATVTFTAYLKQHGKDGSFTEKSFFTFNRGHWLYRNGILEQGHAPNLVTTGQLKQLPMAYYGDPILRKKAEEVGEIDKSIKTLVEEMVATMDGFKGVGLAAPQVHHSIRLFIIRPPVKTKEGQYMSGEVKVFINPKILSRSEKTWVAEEGCLSMPTIYSDVERAESIEVEYTTLEGVRKVDHFSGWEAKIILHENDHIEGILFIDHLDQEKQKKLEPYLKRIEKRIHSGFVM